MEPDVRLFRIRLFTKRIVLQQGAESFPSEASFLASAVQPLEQTSSYPEEEVIQYLDIVSNTVVMEITRRLPPCILPDAQSATIPYPVWASRPSSC